MGFLAFATVLLLTSQFITWWICIWKQFDLIFHFFFVFLKYFFPFNIFSDFHLYKWSKYLLHALYHTPIRTFLKKEKIHSTVDSWHTLFSLDCLEWTMIILRDYVTTKSIFIPKFNGFEYFFSFWLWKFFRIFFPLQWIVRMCMCVWWGVGWYREGDRDEFLLSKSKAFSFKNCILFFFAIKKLNFCWQKF